MANRTYWKKQRFTSLSDPFKAQHVKHPANTVFSISGSHRAMAPALSKILNNRHGLLLSSPPAPVRTVSNKRAMCIVEPEPRASLTEDGDLQTVWPNLSSFQCLESCSHLSLLNVSVNPVLSPCRKASAGSQCETDFLPGRGSLVERFSFNKGQRNVQAVCSAFPGVPGMFLSPAPEHNSQEAGVQHEQSAAPECRPDGGDVHYSSLTFSSVCPLYSHEEIKSQSSGPLFATPATRTQVKQATGAGSPPSASLQPCIGWTTPDQLASTVGLQDALEDQLSRLPGLHDRAGKLQRRLQGLLGEQVVRHCSQQLEGLKRNSQHGKVFLDGLATAGPDVLPPQVRTIPPFHSKVRSKHLDFFTEVEEFSHRSQLVLSDLQTALDSEATANSSSDEEPEENRGRTPPIISSTCEEQCLEERAELASRWSWLELQISELEGRIQQLKEVHKRIRSNKGGVVLADSSPHRDRRIQQSIMKEITGLSCTGTDAEEACSPRRLLHNIERQSALVNSLMLPLSFSPLSKRTTSRKGKRTFTSGQRGDLSLPKSCQRLTNRRLFKADVSGGCARTRPLVSYNKPKLFTFDSHNSSSLLDSTNSASTLSFCLRASSWSCRSSCNPVVLCSDLDCSTSSVSFSSTSRSTGWTPQFQTEKKKRRKRTRLYKGVEYEGGDHDQLYVPEDNSDDVLTGFVRSHQGDSMYINSVLFPMSLTKAEKLHYKEIVTPRWRSVETDSLLEPVNKAFSEDEHIKVEDLSDGVFAQRHMVLERKETLERKYSPRSGSRLSGSVGGMYTSGEESSVECSAQLGADEQSKSEEQLPQTSWEQRVFPLDDEEVASLSDGLHPIPSGWTESTSSNPDLELDQSSGATLPSCGQHWSSTPNRSFPCRSPLIENLEQNMCALDSGVL